MGTAVNVWNSVLSSNSSPGTWNPSARRDLVLVGQGLQEIEGSTENRFLRTEDLLHRTCLR